MNAAQSLGVVCMNDLSKLLILEVVDLVFGDHVELGHFIEVVSLILGMLIARQLGTWIYRRLGVRESTG